MRPPAAKRPFPVLVAALAAGGFVAGCSSGGADKAGGSQAPIVLRMAANVSPDAPARADVDYFAAQVRKASGGKLRVRVSFERSEASDVGFETGIARAVRSGDLDLGWVGAPGWDERGVTSLRALQTPFLITNYALLGRVATGPIATHMLAGLQRAGVVGLALVPAILAHPLALRRPIVKRSDYKGASVGHTPSRTTDALLRAFGATPVPVIGNVPLVKGRVDAELPDSEMEVQTGSCSPRCSWAIGTSVTANVTFFANAETLIASPLTLSRLSKDERAALRTASARTVAHAARQDPDESAGLRTWCQNNGYVATATGRDVAELERASAPVAAQLARDPQTASLVAQIRRLKASTPAPALAVPPDCSLARRTPAAGPRRSPSILNGTYRYVITQKDALAHGDPLDKTPQGLAQYPQVVSQILRDGKWFGGGDCSCELNGTYTITGDRLDFDWNTGYHIRFSYSREQDGTLHLTGLPPMENGDRFIFSTEPWRRVGPPVVKRR